jgi:uncharacterized protein (TIGR03066 family)
MRHLIGFVFTLAVFTTAGLAADEKIDAKKLVGKWEPKDAKKKLVIEFGADGKLTATGEATLTGSWKLDGNKLTLVFKAGENELKDTVTVTKLTDEELVAEDEKKKQTQVMKRVK